MTTEIKPFNPADVVDTIRDRIRSQFVSLIPEETFTAMVKREVDAYLQLRTVHYDQRTISDFQKTIQSVLDEATRKKVVEIIQHPDSGWVNYWGENGRMKCGEATATFLRANMDAVIQSAIGIVIGNVIMNMKPPGQY